MSQILRSRELNLIAMFLAFLAVFVPYFVNVPALDVFSTKLITITAITTAFTLLLAIYSQFRRGFDFVRRKPRGWIFKVYMMSAILLMLLFALGGLETGPYHWVMYAIITPLSSVNYGILAFYLASTCARAFKARNTKSMLLIFTSLIMLFYQAPFTGVYVDLGPIGIYLADTFVMAAGRMFLISVTVGAIVFGVRVLLGQEPSVLGIGREE